MISTLKNYMLEGECKSSERSNIITKSMHYSLHVEKFIVHV